MRYSELLLLVWVFLVSIWARGWLVSFHITDVIFWVGVIFIIMWVAEWLGFISSRIKSPKR